MPLRRREPAKDAENWPDSATASHTDSATSTVPGRATPVTRLATLTGLPNQSPALLTAMPEATPARNRGQSLFASTTVTSFTTTSSMGDGSGQTNITASPIVLMNRTGGSAI